MHPLYKCAGIVLYHHRMACRLDQIDVAKVINMSQSQYSRLETGVNRLQLHQIGPLANLFGIPVQRLLDDIFR